MILIFNLFNLSHYAMISCCIMVYNSQKFPLKYYVYRSSFRGFKLIFSNIFLSLKLETTFCYEFPMANAIILYKFPTLYHVPLIDQINIRTLATEGGIIIRCILMFLMMLPYVLSLPAFIRDKWRYIIQFIQVIITPYG